jgi:hypothetical protein
MTRRLRTFAFVLVFAAAAPGAATADGLPVPGDIGAGSLASADGRLHYVALDAGGATAIAQLRDWRVQRSTLVAGRFTLPVVAYDGSAAGLSADGRTLVLLRPRIRFPRARTTLAVLETNPLLLRKLIDCEATSASTRSRRTGTRST